MINVEDFGIYKLGMTQEEIKDYLVSRYNEKRGAEQKKCLKSTYNKFIEIAGVNTRTCVICSCCKKLVSLMYRHDIERYANQLFNGTPTYFD
jgi:hypothetical protein